MFKMITILGLLVNIIGGSSYDHLLSMSIWTLINQYNDEEDDLDLDLLNIL